MAEKVSKDTYDHLRAAEELEEEIRAEGRTPSPEEQSELNAMQNEGRIMLERGQVAGQPAETLSPEEVRQNAALSAGTDAELKRMGKAILADNGDGILTSVETAREHQKAIVSGAVDRPGR